MGRDWTPNQRVQWAYRNGVDPDLPNKRTGFTQQQNYEWNMNTIKHQNYADYAVQKRYHQMNGEDMLGREWAKGVNPYQTPIAPSPYKDGQYIKITGMFR